MRAWPALLLLLPSFSCARSIACNGRPHLDLGGKVLGKAQVEPTAAACCAACAAASAGSQPCTVWAWCPGNSGGCAAAHNSAKLLQPGLCVLKHFAPAPGSSAGPAVLVEGPFVQWVSGYMLAVALPGDKQKLIGTKRTALFLFGDSTTARLYAHGLAPVLNCQTPDVAAVLHTERVFTYNTPALECLDSRVSRIGRCTGASPTAITIQVGCATKLRE